MSTSTPPSKPAAAAKPAPKSTPAQTAPAGNAAAGQAQAAEEELPPEEESRPMSRKLVWGLAACGSSMVVHLVLLLALGLAMVSTPNKTPPRIIEAAVKDAADPAWSLRSDLTCDHVHPNQAGYQAIAAAIPLDVFTR